MMKRTNKAVSKIDTSTWRPGPRTAARNMNDPRIRKTVSRLRQGYMELLESEEPESISVLKLTEHSGVDRKTFYLHYRNIEDMRNDVIDMKATELIDRLTGDFAQDIATIYESLDHMETGVYDLLTSPDGRESSERFLHQVFTSDAFSRYYDGDDADIVEGYLYSAIYIYEENRRSEDPLDTTELASYTSQLLMNGIRGIEESGD